MEEIINGGMIGAAHIPQTQINPKTPRPDPKDVKSINDLRSWNSGTQLLYQYRIKDATYYEDPRNDGYWWQDPTAILKEIAKYNQPRAKEAKKIEGVDEVIAVEDQKKKDRKGESSKSYKGSLLVRAADDVVVAANKAADYGPITNAQLDAILGAAAPADDVGSSQPRKRKTYPEKYDELFSGVETAGDRDAKRYGLALPEKEPLAGVDLNKKYTKSELDGYLRERLPPAKYHEFKGEKTSKAEKIRLLKRNIESIANPTFNTIDNFDCAICMEECKTVVGGCFTLPCGHRFHRYCIKEYIRSNGTPPQLPCPSCNKLFDTESIKLYDGKARELGSLPANEFSAKTDSAATAAVLDAHAAAQKSAAAAGGAGGAGGGGPASSDGGWSDDDDD
jgi:hypothetical protein